jgi:hypothetical protein
VWLAKFDGTTGAGLAQKSYGGGAGSHRVNGIALDASGNIFIGGYFTNSFPFGSAIGSAATPCTAGSNGCLASSGGQDGFVAKLDGSFNPIWMTRIGVSTADDAIKGIAVDSFGNPTVGGLLNGASTASTITPTTVATAAVMDADPVACQTAPAGCALTSASGSASSYVSKLPGATGLFDPSTSRVTGNSLTSNTNRVAINAKGAGTVKDAVSFGGEFSGAGGQMLNFGGSSTPIGNPGGQASFLVFGGLQ